MPLVEFFERLINLQRSIEIFLIPPSGNIEIRYEIRNIGLLQIRRHCLPLPELVVVGMLHEIVPSGQLLVHILLVEIRNRSQPQKPVEGIEAIEIESLVLLGCFHSRRILQAVAQPERAVMMEIVTQVHVGRRGLLGNSFQRRMRIDHRHHSQPPAIGNPQHSRASVVVGHVLEQPLDGVVGVRAFVNCLCVALRARWPHHHELALRFVAPANILKHENVTLLRQLRIDAAQHHPESLRIKARTIGRPRDQERPSFV